MEHPHHTLFIILALVNANRDKAFCTTPVSKDVPWQPSPLDLVRNVPTARTEEQLRPGGGANRGGVSLCCRSALTGRRRSSAWSRRKGASWLQGWSVCVKPTSPWPTWTPAGTKRRRVSAPCSKAAGTRGVCWVVELSFSHLGLFLGAIPIPADQPIMKIRDLDQVVIPTLELKVEIRT